MKILAIDTAFNACSVAFWDSISLEKKAITEVLERGHAERLMPMLGEVLSNAGAAYADLDLIAVTLGPGAFTGMRVGIATAKALSLATQRPWIGVNSFKSFWATYKNISGNVDYDLYAVLLETKRDDYYFGMLDKNGNEIEMPVCCRAEFIIEKLENKNYLIIGNTVEHFICVNNLSKTKYNQNIFSFNYPDPTIIAQEALNILDKGGDIFDMSPVYLREADVTLPKKAERYLKIY